MAFKDAGNEGAAILSFTNHDFRDMSVDIDDVYERIHRVWSDYKNVSLINSDAVSAMQATVYREQNMGGDKIRLSSEIKQDGSMNKLIVTCNRGEVFGSQPYIAIKTREGRYYHDNLNEREFRKSWEYIFDRSTIDLSNIEKVSVASNDKYGNQSITRFQR